MAIARKLVLYRISTYATLSGIGGMHAAGRWNSKGSLIVYLATSPSAAMLEILVHLPVRRGVLPESYQLLTVDVSDEAAVTEIQVDFDGWQKHPELTRRLGDAWLTSGRTPLARVPSSLTPETWNYLLNPSHADAGLARIVKSSLNPYDPRFFNRIAKKS